MPKDKRPIIQAHPQRMARISGSVIGGLEMNEPIRVQFQNGRRKTNLPGLSREAVDNCGALSYPPREKAFSAFSPAFARHSSPSGEVGLFLLVLGSVRGDG